MKIVQPVYEIVDHNNLLRNIELGGRVCYKSEDKMGEGTDVALINKLKSFKHESVFEHGVITVKFLTDRGVTHELVRHRIAAFSQESTRYCNYAKDKFGNEISVVDPFFFNPDEDVREVIIPDVGFADFGNGNSPCLSATGRKALMNSFDVWMLTCLWTEWGYNTLTQQFKRSAQEARSVLPNSLKTEIQVTSNVREWRHILTLRTSRDAHPQIRQIMVPLGRVLAEKWPVLFGDFADTEHPNPAHMRIEDQTCGVDHDVLSGGCTAEQGS